MKSELESLFLRWGVKKRVQLGLAVIICMGLLVLLTGALGLATWGPIRLAALCFTVSPLFVLLCMRPR